MMNKQIKTRYNFPKGSIQITIQQTISKVVNELFNIQLDPTEINIERPKDSTHGDFATNIAMQLVKALKSNPREIAEKLVVTLRHSKGEILFKNVEIAGPGFINLTLDTQTKFDNAINPDLSLNEFAGQKTIIEFTDPNPFKEFHIGHLYSNTVGESLSRLHESMGAEVKRADYYGDVGMHVSKSLWGLMAKLEEDNLTIDDLEKRELKDRIQYLGQSYAKGATAYKDNESAQEIIKDINYAVFIAGQEYLVETTRWKPLINYKQYLENNDLDQENIKNLYFKGKKWSLEYFEQIFERVGTKFDYYFPESIAAEYGMQAVQEGIEKGVFEESNGAIIFDGEKHGLHTRVFVNALGLPTYEAKELGLAPSKYLKFKYDKSIIITADEINEYFKVLLKALSFVHPELEAKTTHIGHGVVALPDGKMSSRTGKIITGESLIDAAKDKAIEIIKESGRISEEAIDEVAEIIAIGGIKYAFLRNAVGGDIVYSFEESISFEGNSGPYIQYTYARCKAIGRKADSEVIARNEAISLTDLQPTENTLINLLGKYKEVVFEATQNLSPHIMCNYLFDLAQEFNSFYQACKVIGDKHQDRRLLLVNQTAEILKVGLWNLGIKTVERM